MMLINRPLALAALVSATVFTWSAAPAASTRDVPRVGAEPTATAAADAAMAGDAGALRTLVRGGVNVNTPQGDGMTALHWAAERGDADAAALLLKAGADVRAVTRIGAHTPLHIAAKSGAVDVVRQLVAAKADVRAVTTTGATPLHFAAASGSRDAVAVLLDAGADPNVREPQWGQTPLMFAAAAGRTEVVRTLLARGADPRISATVVNISERNRQDSAESRARNARVAAIQKERAAAAAAAAAAGRPAAPAAPAARRARNADGDDGGEPEPLGYADLVGAQGGLTALLLAAREGLADTVFTLLDGGADLNQVSASDHTSPLLIASINGHFDLAMRLVARGADVNRASDAGGTPLYGVLNMQWAPKARHPQPAKYMQQTTGYLELAETLLKAGANPNARLTKSLWYTTYNRDLLGVDRTGATPFWLAAYTLDIPAMRLLLKYGADPTIGTSRVPERYEEGGPDPSGPDRSGLPMAPWSGPAVAPIHAASGVGYGLGFAGNTHRHVPDGWVPAVKFLVEELGADVNARDHNGYTPLHHAAARGDNELITYLVSKGADVKAVARSGQTTVDMANGPVQRIEPFPETIKLLESLGAKNNHRCVGC
ncbi:MAG TPA: ankyrin repeat domain-containing protein [Vicinamibacterales bacterium]|nr:ankyrin repeat domain-containing protein [Vicinamibacterales bacterium]